MSMLLALGLSSACSNSDEEFSDEGFNVSDGTVIAIGDSGLPEDSMISRDLAWEIVKSAVLDNKLGFSVNLGGKKIITKFNYLSDNQYIS